MYHFFEYFTEKLNVRHEIWISHFPHVCLFCLDKYFRDFSNKVTNICDYQGEFTMRRLLNFSTTEETYELPNIINVFKKNRT